MYDTANHPPDKRRGKGLGEEFDVDEELLAKKEKSRLSIKLSGLKIEGSSHTNALIRSVKLYQIFLSREIFSSLNCGKKI